MNTKLIFALCTFVLSIKVSSCAYPIWEVINNRWYADDAYDRHTASIRQSEMEQNCTNAVGENEELCFDDCMLRHHYHLIELKSDFDWEENEIFVYSVDEMQGLNNLEKNVLQLEGETSNTGMYLYPVRHESFLKRFSACQLALHVDSETDAKLRKYELEATKNFCTLLLNKNEKETVTTILNCVKEQILN